MNTPTYLNHEACAAADGVGTGVDASQTQSKQTSIGSRQDTSQLALALAAVTGIPNGDNLCNRWLCQAPPINTGHAPPANAPGMTRWKPDFL